MPYLSRIRNVVQCCSTSVASVLRAVNKANEWACQKQKQPATWLCGYKAPSTPARVKAHESDAGNDDIKLNPAANWCMSLFEATADVYCFCIPFLVVVVFFLIILWVWRLHVPISQSVSSICHICYFYTIFPFMCLQLFCLELELPAKPFIYFGHILFLNILQIWCIEQLIERIHKTLYTQHFALQQKI